MRRCGLCAHYHVFLNGPRAGYDGFCTKLLCYVTGRDTFAEECEFFKERGSK
jgi:hypothetical protein